MIGCLMIGPVSLQAQVSSGKVTEALASGKQVWLVADSGRMLRRGAEGAASAPLQLPTRNGVALFAGSPSAPLPSAPLPSVHASGSYPSGSFSAGRISPPLPSGRLASGRLFFGGLPADGPLADKVSFGSFLFNRLSKDGRSNDNFLQRTAPSSASSLPPSPAYLMTSHAYYDQHFGFFCKKEWVWQKQTGIPVKLRLGSYDLTQRQEGK